MDKGAMYKLLYTYELGLAKKSTHSTTWQFKTMKNH